MSLDGINYLVAVTQMKSSNANDAAIDRPVPPTPPRSIQAIVDGAIFSGPALQGLAALKTLKSSFGDGDIVALSSTKLSPSFAGQRNASEAMTNFAIQTLMSSYNQAESLANSVYKKSDDTASSVAGKV
jgi:hypothetical protein